MRTQIGKMPQEKKTIVTLYLDMDESDFTKDEQPCIVVLASDVKAITQSLCRACLTGRSNTSSILLSAIENQPLQKCLHHRST